MIAFDAEDYPFWFLRLTRRIAEAVHIGVWRLGDRRYGWAIGAVLVGVGLYVLGLAAATVLGMPLVYVRTKPFALGAVGVAWVLFTSTQAVRILAKGLSEIKQASLEPGAFHRYVDTTLRRAAAWRTTIPWAVGIAVVLGAWVVVGLLRWHRVGEHATGHGFATFPVEWHTGAAFVAATLLLVVFGAAVAITLATSVELLVRNLPFVWGLQRFRYLPLPGRVRLALRPLINAYAWTSITWSLGIALFVVLGLGSSWSRVAIAAIAVLVAIGLATFLVPYWSFRRVLDASHEEMSEILCKAIEQRSRRGTLDVANVSAVAAANRALAGDPPPVLTRRGALTYAFAQLVAFAAVVTKGLLSDRVSALAVDGSSRPRARSTKHVRGRALER